MHAHDEHFLVVAAVEDRDFAAFRQMRRGPPEKIMCQLAAARLLEGSDVETDGIHAVEHVANRAVLARRVDGLKNREHGIAPVGVEPILRVAELLDLVLEQLFPVVLALGAATSAPYGCRTRRRTARAANAAWPRTCETASGGRRRRRRGAALGGVPLAAVRLALEVRARHERARSDNAGPRRSSARAAKRRRSLAPAGDGSTR